LHFFYRLGLAVVRFGDRRQFGPVQVLNARFLHGSFRLVVHAHSCAEITEIRGVFATVALPYLTSPKAALPQVASRACESEEFFHFYSTFSSAGKVFRRKNTRHCTVDGWSHSLQKTAQVTATNFTGQNHRPKGTCKIDLGRLTVVELLKHHSRRLVRRIFNRKVLCGVWDGGEGACCQLGRHRGASGYPLTADAFSLLHTHLRPRHLGSRSEARLEDKRRAIGARAAPGQKNAAITLPVNRTARSRPHWK
jgi:hypothetical protein